MKQININDIWCAIVISLVGGMLGFEYGHHGFIAAVMTLCGLWIFGDCLKICQWCSNGQEPLAFLSSSGPQCPQLPVYWYAAAVIFQVAGLALQLIFGFTLCSGLVLWSFYVGASGVLHLKYYSGAVEDNALTLIPEIFLSLVILSMVMSAPLTEKGYMGVGVFGALFLLEVAAIAGAAIGWLFLRFTGVTADVEDEVRKLTWTPSDTKQSPSSV